jgi:DNA polymerase elongation subunit (family B)
MKWIVFDIEASPFEISDDEIARYLAYRKSMLSLSTHPIFSKVIHIGVMWDEGTEHFSGNEEEVLDDFWDFFESKGFVEGLTRDRYGNYLGETPPIQLVTFNGDEFDVPFALVRSSLHNIKPTIDINTYPYRDMTKSNHFDCLRFISGTDLRKKVKLEIVCRALEIEVPERPKESIMSLYRKGKFDQIRQKNEQDLELTREVYQKLTGEPT